MQQFAATRRRDRLLQQSVTCENHCRCDLSREFTLVWIRATNRNDKIGASSFVAAAVQTRRLVAAMCRKVFLGLSGLV